MECSSRLASQSHGARCRRVFESARRFSVVLVEDAEMSLLGYSSAAELDELNADDAIIDYAFFTAENFLLIVLLTSKGDIQVLCEVGKEKARRRVASVPLLWGRAVEPVAVCIGPEASFLAFALADGDILIVPMKLVLEVVWGVSRYISESSPVLLPIAVSADVCLRTPTCITCFASTYSSSPYLLYGNKAGQVLIVDLMTRKLTVELQAPESVHKVDVFRTNSSADLLVTGFTGAQWLVPLESPERGIRETLSVVIPSELPVLTAGTVCRVDDGVAKIDVLGCSAQLLPTLSTAFHQNSNAANVFQGLPTPVSFMVPEETWQVHVAWKVAFALSLQSSVYFMPFYGLKLSKDLGARWQRIPVAGGGCWRCLGLVPGREAIQGEMPQCFVVTERSLLRIIPDSNGSAEAWLVDCLLAADFPAPSQMKEVAATMLEGVPAAARPSMEKLLGAALESVGRGQPPMNAPLLLKLLNVAKIAEISMDDLLALFERSNLEHVLLPQILVRIESNPRDSSKKKLIPLILRAVEVGTRARDDSDCLLSSLLCRHIDLVSGFASLLPARLWRSASLLLPRDEANHAAAVRFFSERGAELWQAAAGSERVLMACCLWPVRWELAEEADVVTLLTTLAAWQMDMEGDVHFHQRCLSIALDNEQRCPMPARLLYVMCSMCSLSSASSAPSRPPAPRALLTAGFNCSLAYGIDKKLLFWGDLSASLHKTFEAEDSPSRARVSSSISSTDSMKTTATGSPRAGSLKSSPPPGQQQHQQPTPVSLSLPDVQCVVAGAEHVLLLSADGRMLSWGKNRYGQCGVGHEHPVPQPTELEDVWSGVASISAGHFHNACVLEDGSLFSWGWGMYGQLGHARAKDPTANRSTPTRIDEIPEKMLSVSCGRAHTVLLGRSGSVWVVGCGTYGQLGNTQDILKEFDFQRVVLPVAPEVRATHIATAFYHTVVATGDGRLFEWGRNPHELKMKMFLMKRLRKPVDAASGEENHLPMHIPKELLGVVEVRHQLQSPVCHLSTGLAHSALITESGALFTWGKAIDFQLGHGVKTERTEPCRVVEPEGLTWTSVYAGSNHNVASTADGRVWSWGRNDVGQCGVRQALRGPGSAPSSPRRLFLHAKDGASRKVIQLPDEAAFVALPTLVPSAVLAQHQGGDTMDRDRLLSSLRGLDASTASQASRHLRLSASPIAAHAVVHLLAGEVQAAIECIGYTEEAPKENGHENTNGKEEERERNGESRHSAEALISLCWDIVANHEDCQTRAVCSAAFARLPLGARRVACRQLRALWPAVWDTPNGQRGLEAADKAAILATWAPLPTPIRRVHIPTAAVDAVHGRARVHAACGHLVESAPEGGPLGGGTPSGGTPHGGPLGGGPSNPSSSEACAVCVEEWRQMTLNTFREF